MNTFQRRKDGISSQLSVKTTRKKAANVTVGNSTTARFYRSIAVPVPVGVR